VVDANAVRTQMADSSSITALVTRLRSGDSDAARELFTYYADRLSGLAEQHLSRKLAGRVEPEDVVESALRTFFLRSARGEFQIDSRAELWQLLVRITVVKAREQARFHRAARRDVGAEQGQGDEDWLGAAGREPGPADAAILLDEIAAVLRGLPDLHCQVLQQRLQGYSVAEIAAQLGVARQTVYRALQVLQRRFAERQRSHE
jgi:RNA polymerase sigma-70 factor (ECF subfamily)